MNQCDLPSFPLLSLTRDELAIVVAKVDEKYPLRLACAQLRDTVDSAVTSLSRGRVKERHGLVFTPSLLMRLPRLANVEITSAGDIGDLTPLAACITLRTLICCYTAVCGLAPLAECITLQTLNCHNTAVSSLVPLAACTSL